MDVSNYFELCSNYVAGNVFVLKRWRSVSQDPRGRFDRNLLVQRSFDQMTLPDTL